MGGAGSGTYYRWDKKQLTDESLPLDIRVLKRKGLLIPEHTITSTWSSGGRKTARILAKVYDDHLLLAYEYKNTEIIQQRVWLDWTPCHFGGERVWFRCPNCHRRCAIIYGGERYFACRKCYDLVYESSREMYCQRLLNRTYKLKKKLGDDHPTMDSPIPNKPKGMHWKTYNRIRAEIERLSKRADNAVIERFGLIF